MPQARMWWTTTHDPASPSKGNKDKNEKTHSQRACSRNELVLVCFSQESMGSRTCIRFSNSIPHNMCNIWEDAPLTVRNPHICKGQFLPPRIIILLLCTRKGGMPWRQTTITDEDAASWARAGCTIYRVHYGLWSRGGGSREGIGIYALLVTSCCEKLRLW